MYKIPALRVDKKNKAEVPEWLDVSEIISTSTKRGSSGQVVIYHTSSGEYYHAINVEHMLLLLKMASADFVRVDRGSLINIEYLKSIDKDWNVAVLNDKNGEEKRVTILASELEKLLYMFDQLYKNTTAE